MWRAPVVTVAATEEPLDVEAVKEALRITNSREDDLIDGYIAAARSYVEGVTATQLCSRTVVIRTDDWSDLANLPVAPVTSVTSITYTDTDGATQTLATSVYEARLFGLEPQIVLKFNQTWPTIRVGSLIVITLVAGYGAATAVPADVLQAMRLLVGDYYAHRETVQVGSVSSSIGVAAGVDALLANHTKHLI